MESGEPHGRNSGAWHACQHSWWCANLPKAQTTPTWQAHWPSARCSAAASLTGPAAVVPCSRRSDRRARGHPPPHHRAAASIPVLCGVVCGGSIESRMHVTPVLVLQSVLGRAACRTFGRDHQPAPLPRPSVHDLHNVYEFLLVCERPVDLQHTPMCSRTRNHSRIGSEPSRHVQPAQVALCCCCQCPGLS